VWVWMFRLRRRVLTFQLRQRDRKDGNYCQWRDRVEIRFAEVEISGIDEDVRTDTFWSEGTDSVVRFEFRGDNLSIMFFHSPPSATRISSNLTLNSFRPNRFSSCILSVATSMSSSSLARRSRRKCFILSACFNRNSVTLVGNGRVRIRIVTSPFGEVIVAVPLLPDESFNATISTINKNLQARLPGALTIVSRNGTIGLLAEISIFANRSRKSFKQRYLSASHVSWRYFQMQFPSRKNDMFSTILHQNLNTTIRLIQQSQPLH
jgi:hypothetical protein